MEGRETGSEGQKKAGRYLIEQYKKAGIPFPKGADSYYQKVPAPRGSKAVFSKQSDLKLWHIHNTPSL